MEENKVLVTEMPLPFDEKDLEEKEKEVNTLKQKISDLEQVCQAKEY